MLERLNNIPKASRVSSVADCQGASNLSRGVAVALPLLRGRRHVALSFLAGAHCSSRRGSSHRVTYSGYFTVPSANHSRKVLVNNRGRSPSPLRGDTRVKFARVVDAPVDKRASSWKPAGGSRACDVASVSRVVTVDRKKRASITSARSNEIERDYSIRMHKLRVVCAFFSLV